MSDLIYRQEAIEALGEEPPVWNDEYHEIAEREQWRSDVKAIEAVPSAQPDLQPTCNQLATDCISRQNAIDALKICDNNEDGINCHKCPLRDERWDGAWQDDETNCYTKLMRDSAKLLEMPSAQPESETGTWILKHHVWWCSECGKNPTKGTGYVQRAEELFDYCPHCGKKMEGVQI